MPLVTLQPAVGARLFPPGVQGMHIRAMFEAAGISMAGPAEESLTARLLRLARQLLDPPEKLLLAWHFLDGVRCVWVDGGNLNDVDCGKVAEALRIPVFSGGGGMFAGEEGGLAMLEELECERGMVCDLGQTMLKVSWAGRRWSFERDVMALPLYGGTGAHTIGEKGAQRRELRRFIAQSLRTVISDTPSAPDGVIFALPSVMDKWGQPAGSSYIGMSMDTQLVTDSMELAGLPDVPHWLLNDAELAAASAIFDDRVIQHGKALVFTVGTALGCALADPLAAARHFMAA